MAKRFTDTELWDKEWFMALKPRLKCLVKYARDKCNLAGVWDPNWALAATHIGEKVSEKELLSIDHGRQFLKTEQGRIFCIGFVSFQYGDHLNEKSPVHKKIIDILKKYTVGGDTLLDTLSNRVCNTLKEEEEEEEEEKEEEEKEKEDKEGGTGETGPPAAEKPKTVYQQCVGAYFDFFAGMHDGDQPKFDKTHGENLKAIIKHISKNVAVKQPGLSPPEHDAKVVVGFRYILDNWDKLSDFSKQFVDVRSMNSNFNRIHTELKNNKGTTKINGNSKSNGATGATGKPASGAKSAGASNLLSSLKSDFGIEQ